MQKLHQMPSEWLEHKFMPKGEWLFHMHTFCDSVREIFIQDESPLENHANIVTELLQAEKAIHQLIDKPAKNLSLVEQLQRMTLGSLEHPAERARVSRIKVSVLRDLMSRCIKAHNAILALVPPELLSDMDQASHSPSNPNTDASTSSAG